MVGENGEGFLRVTDSVRAHPFHSIFIDFRFLGFLSSLPPPSFLDLFFPSPLSRTSSTEAGPTGPNQEQQDRTRANRINRTEPGPTGPNQDKEDRARPNRTEPGQAGPNQDSRWPPGEVWEGLGRLLERLGEGPGASWKGIVLERLGDVSGRLEAS